MRGGSGERLGSWGAVQGGAPEVWGQVFAGVGFAVPDGWSGMGVPGECRIGGREGASLRGGGGGCCCLGSSGPASRSSAARCGPRAFGSQRQRKSLKTFFPLLPTSSSLLPLLLPSSPQWRRRRWKLGQAREPAGAAAWTSPRAGQPPSAPRRSPRDAPGPEPCGAAALEG